MGLLEFYLGFGVWALRVGGFRVWGTLEHQVKVEWKLTCKLGLYRAI